MSKLTKLRNIIRETEGRGEFWAILPDPATNTRYDVFVANSDIFKEFWKWFGTYSRPDNEPVPKLMMTFKNVEDLFGEGDA